MRGYDIFLNEINEVTSKYPKLKKVDKDGHSYLSGELDIVDANGLHWDTYEVEIHCREGYPKRYPSLYEVGGKIPRIADWHIYEDTGSCCVNVLQEEIIRCKDGITLLQYIEEEVLPYLFNQTNRRVEGYYVNGEYSHGLIGEYEFYSRILKTGSDIRKTVEWLLFVAGGKKLSRTDVCFCGSNRKYRKCHRDAYDKLSILGEKYLKEDASRIAKSAGLI